MTAAGGALPRKILMLPLIRRTLHDHIDTDFSDDPRCCRGISAGCGDSGGVLSDRVAPQ